MLCRNLQGVGDQRTGFKAFKFLFFFLFFLIKEIFFQNAQLDSKVFKVMVKKLERERKMGGMETLVKNRH